ncbi:MAG TPA: hybrid sensor histidine kinase/response regulator [Bacteroidetes bacterium]|nr:hybrid sensor histidine kinase/response regulator [Bacteroidota bacterium]
MTRVLVIDDEGSIRETILLVLRRNGFEAYGVENGIEGLKQARKRLPDLIVCDVRMELVDGYQVLTAIRNDPTTASIPFILITAEQARADIRHGMDLGADDFLTKPFTSSEILSAVNARLQKHKMLIQQAENKLEQLRYQLSTSLPHELRTPLNGVLGYADILRKQFAELEPMEVSQMAERIYKNGKRLHRLVENFLIYAQIEILKMDYQKIESLRKTRTPDIGKIIDVLARQRAYESDRSMDLDLQLESADVAISSDYFSKIFEELFDNAIRYSRKGSPLHIHSSCAGREFVLQVQDNGRGMTPEQLHSIGAYMQFERKIYEQQGSGLGLTVAKRLAELHGGTLRMKSEYGKGTTSTVILPLAPGNGEVGPTPPS